MPPHSQEVARCQLEINRLKTDTQLAVARGREAIRTKKDLEIADLRHKMEEVHQLIKLVIGYSCNTAHFL